MAVDDHRTRTNPKTPPFVMLPLWAKARIKAATLAAREADDRERRRWLADVAAGLDAGRPERRCTRCALDLYLELRRRADHATGLVRRLQQRDLTEIGNRATVRRATAILRAAGVITTETLHDERGHVCAMRYAIALAEPADGAGLCSSRSELAGVFEQEQTGAKSVPMFSQRQAYVQLAAPQVLRSSSQIKEQKNTATRKNTVAPSAPVTAATMARKPEAEKQLISKMPARPNFVRRVIHTVLDEQPAVNDPDLADAVRARLGAGVAASECTIRALIEAVRLKRAGLLPDRQDRKRAAPPREPEPGQLPGLLHAAPHRVSAGGVVLRPPVDAAEAERWRQMDEECAAVIARQQADRAAARDAQQPELLSATA